MPKNGLKFKKYHKSKIKNVTAMRLDCCPDTNNAEIILLESIRIVLYHTNAIRRTVRRLIKKIGRLCKSNVLYFPITQKPAQIRMGKGKGGISYWAGKVLAGTSIAYFKQISKKTSFEVMLAASTKIAGRTRVLYTCDSRYSHVLSILKY
jgi:large subunit ribosomal protein L16